MPSVTVKVSEKGSLSDLFDRILWGAQTGLYVGGEAMKSVVQSTVGDMARYPTGELAQSVQYEPLTEGVISTSRIVAGTDHAEEFEYGTFPHFVPYEEADERIIQGLYPHIKPIYENSSLASGGHGGNAAGKEPTTNKTPIGYIVYSDEHPFMSAGFEASRQTVVQEIANNIEIVTGG